MRYVVSVVSIFCVCGAHVRALWHLTALTRFYHTELAMRRVTRGSLTMFRTGA